MSRFNIVPRLALVGSIALLAACGGDKDGAASSSTSAAAATGDTPHGAVLGTADMLRRGDFNALITASVPPAQLEAAKQRFMEDLKSQEITDESRAEFAQTMERLTAPDAEARMMAEIRPQLEQLQSPEMKAQLPAMIAMGKGFALQAINESQDMTATQKSQATGILNAVASWAETGEFADIGRAERAVAAITRTARSFPVKTLDELHALDFNGMVGLLSTAFDGLKGVFNAYDIDLDQTIASVKAETVSQEGDNANVRVKMSFLGAPLEFDTQMVRVDGRWYGKDTIDQLNKADSAPAAN